MKITIFVGVVLLSLILPGKAGAQATTGNEIQSKCKQLLNDNESFSSGFCAGFVDGVVDSQDMWEASDKMQNRSHVQSFCLPGKSTNGQLVRVFIKYLDDHPERLNEPAALLLVESLRKAFPCGK